MQRHDVRGEDGSILIVAVVLMAVMLSVALSSVAVVDSQQQHAIEQRQRETSLNLAEAVLYSQGFVLAGAWPGNAADGAAMPTTCTSAALASRCPDPGTLASGNSSSPASANFTSVDASSRVSWSTTVRDNGGPLADAFDFANVDAAQTTGAATCAAPCKWDFNGDRRLWVQARAVVAGRPRNIVALLKREQFAEAFARNAVTAGSFETTNNGNKAIIDVTGSQVVVRCAPLGGTCTDYEVGKGQVIPAPISVPSTPSAMTSDQLARFMAAAKSANPSRYHTSCPDSYAGAVVFVDLPTASSCTDSNSATYNSPSSPGIVIMARGTLTMKSTFHGLVYMVNGPGNEAHLSSAVLTMAANGQIIGGLAIDGPGRLLAGSASGNRPSVQFDPNAFNSLVSFGTTALVQNTWRELLAS